MTRVTDPAKKSLVLYGGSSHIELAEDVAKEFGTPLGGVDIHRFANGEVYARLLESIRGSDVFVLQTHAEPVNEHIVELLVLLDALKRASSARITAVLPLFPYSRQDQKSLPREPISAKLMADLLHAAGADRVMSIDLHAGQVQGFFDIPFDHLTAWPLLVDKILEDFGSDVVICAPDAGGVKRADKVASRIGADLAILHKRRNPKVHDTNETLDVVGDVKGRVCVLVDDRIDTGGTLVAGAQLLKERGASETHAVAVHPVFAGNAVDKLRNSELKQVVVTDSVPVPDEKRFKGLSIVSVAPIISEAIRAVFQEESVSGIFGGDNL